MGDLVFFHTGKTKHVGIYIDNGQFMHASTKLELQSLKWMMTILEIDIESYKSFKIIF